MVADEDVVTEDELVVVVDAMHAHAAPITPVHTSPAGQLPTQTGARPPHGSSVDVDVVEEVVVTEDAMHAHGAPGAPAVQTSPAGQAPRHAGEMPPHGSSVDVVDVVDDVVVLLTEDAVQAHGAPGAAVQTSPVGQVPKHTGATPPQPGRVVVVVGGRHCSDALPITSRATQSTTPSNIERMVSRSLLEGQSPRRTLCRSADANRETQRWRHRTAVASRPGGASTARASQTRPHPP